jgi:hypothetical protein
MGLAGKGNCPPEQALALHFLAFFFPGFSTFSPLSCGFLGFLPLGAVAFFFLLRAASISY